MSSNLRLRRARRFCGAHVAGGFSRADNDPLNKTDPLGLRPSDGPFMAMFAMAPAGASFGGGSSCSLPLPNGGSIDIPTPSFSFMGYGLSDCGIFQLGTSRTSFDDGMRLPGSMRHMSEQGQQWQVQWEANVLGAYNDSEGNCSVARGILLTNSRCTSEQYGQWANLSYGQSVLVSEKKVFEIEAAFRSDVASTLLTQWEWDALVDVAWNGPNHGAFRRLLTGVNTALDDGSISGGERSAIRTLFQEAGLGVDFLGPRREGDADMFLNGD